MSILDEVASLEKEVLGFIAKADSADTLKELQVRYLGRKGPLASVLRSLGKLPVEERKEVGAKANQARSRLEQTFTTAAENFAPKITTAGIDPTLPGISQNIGAVHILNQVMAEMCQIFYGMGFETAMGPHVETDYFNFESLNFPPDHPARDNCPPPP